MPVLPISDGNGKQLQLARWTTMAHMIYPSPELAVWREPFIAGRLAEQLLEKNPNPDDKITVNHSLLKALLNAPSQEKIKESVHRYAAGGILAGMILYVVVQMHQHSPGDASISKATDAVITLNELEPAPDFPCSRAHVKEQWRIYKPISALWAALLFLDMHSDEPQDLDEMASNRFILFMEIAEFFRKNGESIVAQRAQKFGPVLDPDATWRFPPDLGISDLSYMILPDPTPDLLDSIRNYRAPKRF